MTDKKPHGGTGAGREPKIDAEIDDAAVDPGQVGPDSAGQSGDTQGLSDTEDAADQSVESLADSGQSYEAEVISGVEDAADHPEQPVPTHEDRRKPER